MYCKTTLCWTCGNAVGGGCSWSENLTPVRGWEAVREMESYTVLRCPEYQRDSFGDGLYRDGNDYYPDDRKSAAPDGGKKTAGK